MQQSHLHLLGSLHAEALSTPPHLCDSASDHLANVKQLRQVGRFCLRLLSSLPVNQIRQMI